MRGTDCSGLEGGREMAERGEGQGGEVEGKDEANLGL